ncbi:VanZ family protein [Pelobium manganitolerans]|uniref:VanZ family protein n=1 Tax=Pelobium manganitolerans TaxID=1842495 RepID=UPI003FA3BB62
MLKTLKFQWPAMLWALLVLILCDVPMSDVPGSSHFFEGFDKMVHLGFFFVLTVLLFYGKIKQQNSFEYRLLTIVKIVAINVCVGGGIEILQWKVFTYRSAEWWDFFSDMLGLGMGVFSYLLLHRKSRSLKTTSLRS